ncbi:class I SAM-dependent methyltransferase [Magnetospirillum sp. 15-1]|uniref:class I SAM-dependent methyltransferase n=1 Tax=Magnetospirillum sp. 15-1 TaxID=1979370 RepID=UPI000BBC8194|nr:class I SAM-dependent methyltransferase [Magnetospirillum sp. 15-1]
MAEIVGSTQYMNSDYVEYQKKYRRDMRESDRVTSALIKDNLPAGDDLTLLDIGCHNGNLLYHLKNALPTLRMTGGDLFQGVIDGCRSAAPCSNHGVT